MEFDALTIERREFTAQTADEATQHLERYQSIRRADSSGTARAGDFHITEASVGDAIFVNYLQNGLSLSLDSEPECCITVGYLHHGQLSSTSGSEEVLAGSHEAILWHPGASYRIQIGEHDADYLRLPTDCLLDTASALGGTGGLEFHSCRPIDATMSR